jgi:hypothetical protein
LLEISSTELSVRSSVIAVVSFLTIVLFSFQLPNYFLTQQAIYRSRSLFSDKQNRESFLDFWLGFAGL